MREIVGASWDFIWTRPVSEEKQGESEEKLGE